MDKDERPINTGEDPRLGLFNKVTQGLLKFLHRPMFSERLSIGRVTVIESSEGTRFYRNNLPLPEGFIDANLVPVEEA